MNPAVSSAAGFLLGASLYLPVRAGDLSPVNGMLVLDPMLAGAALVLALRCPWTWRAAPWPLVIACLVGVSVTWAADPRATAWMAVRIASAGVLVRYLTVSGDARWIAAGALFPLGFHAALLLRRIGLTRQAGIAATITTLGMLSVFPALLSAQRLPWRLRAAAGIVAAIGLSAAGSRSPWAAATALQARAGRPGLALAAVTVVTFVGGLAARGEIARITDSRTLARDAETRAATVKIEGQVSPWASVSGHSWVDDFITSRGGGESNGGELTWLGYGLDGYDVAAGWPRPHNAYSLLVFELGVFALLPAAAAGIYLWRRRSLSTLVTAAIIATWMLLDESMVSPEGVWGLVLVLSVGGALARHSPKRDGHRAENTCFLNGAI